MQPPTPGHLPTTDAATARRFASLPGWELWLRLDDEGDVITLVAHQDDRRVLKVRTAGASTGTQAPMPGWPSA